MNRPALFSVSLLAGVVLTPFAFAQPYRMSCSALWHERNSILRTPDIASKPYLTRFARSAMQVVAMIVNPPVGCLLGIENASIERPRARERLLTTRLYQRVVGNNSVLGTTAAGFGAVFTAVFGAFRGVVGRCGREAGGRRRSRNQRLKLSLQALIWFGAQLAPKIPGKIGTAHLVFDFTGVPYRSRRRPLFRPLTFANRDNGPI